MNVRFLECTAIPGMFYNELCVAIVSRGTKYSFFAPVESVSEHGSKSFVEVELLDVASCTVALPGDTYERGNQFLQVAAEELKDGPG